MSRRDSHILVELARLPWWVSVVVAGVVYVAIRWLSPAIAGDNRFLAPLAHTFSAQARWIAAIFLLPIPFALFNARRRRNLLDGQSSIDSIRALPWQEFERLVGEAYRRQGYRVTERGGAQADGGIDLELRSNDKTLVVQCKHWQTRTIGVALVRELYGAMAGEAAHAAIFVTSGSYTPDAIDFARDKPIKLVDGPSLVEMLRGIQGKQLATAVELPVVKDIATTGAICPRCGSAMVQRIAKRGAQQGSSFWGCSRYPKCHGTRPA